MSLIKFGIIVEIFLFVGVFLWVRKLNSKQSNKKTKFYRLKRTPLEIVNRLFFFFFIGSLLFSLFLAYSESKLWFILYVISALSCVFYTPNRKAIKELISAWPNIEDLMKGRSMWRKGK